MNMRFFLVKLLVVGRGVSSLGSARNLAREPHVFKSSARLGSIFRSSRKLEVIFFGSKTRTHPKDAWNQNIMFQSYLCLEFTA